MRKKISAFFEKAAPTREVDIHKDIILYLEDITVSFDGFKAINSLNLYIKKNELRCIIGPNGAGKTTMMDIVTGKQNQIMEVLGLGRILTC